MIAKFQNIQLSRATLLGENLKSVLIFIETVFVKSIFVLFKFHAK